MKLPLLASLALASLSVLACSADAGDGGAAGSDPLVCLRCGHYPPPPPPTPPTVPALPPCGPNGILERRIALFTAGNVDATPSAIENEPVRYRFQVTSLDPVGLTFPVVLDGQAIDVTMGSDGVARGSLATPDVFAPASTPLTHTLSVSGACGTRSQTITLTPVTEKEVYFPYAHLTASVYSLAPGQSTTLTWGVGDTNVRIYDCAVTSLALGWRSQYAPGNTGPFQGVVPIAATGSMTVGPINGSVTYSILQTCAAHPLFTNVPTAAANIGIALPPDPVIKSFKTSSTYVNQDTSVTLSWDIDFGWCATPEVVVTGDSEDRVGTRVFREALAANNGAGSIKVNVGEWTRYALSASCPNGSTAHVGSGTVDVHVYIPPGTPNASFLCFKAECTYAGCTTQSVPTTDASAAEAALDQIYPPSSGCTTETIDCSKMASACPDPFAP